MKKIIIILLMFLLLTGCSDFNTDEIDTKIDNIEIELTSIAEDILVFTNDFENFEPDDVLIEVDSLYERLTILENDLEGLNSEDVEDLEDELIALTVAFDALSIKVTQIENDTVLSDKITLLEILVNDLAKGNTLSEIDINYIIDNYVSITQSNLGFRFLGDFNTEEYTNSCTNFVSGPILYDYCFDTIPLLKLYDSSFSNVFYDIINFQLTLQNLDDLLSNITNYDESPLIVEQNFEINNYVISSIKSNDTSLLFTVSEDNITDDYMIVIAKDETKEILLLEAILYDDIPTNNMRIRMVLDYDYNLLEIQLQDGDPASGGVLYYYSNYNEIQEFHFIGSDTAWRSIIQDSTYYVTTGMQNIGGSQEHTRVATYKDDGLIMMIDDYASQIFFVHHTAFNNIKRIALAYDNYSDEYIKYSDDTVYSYTVDISSDLTHMKLIPAQDHFITGDTISNSTISTIMFYNSTINIDSIESDYNIVFKYDKIAVLSLLNTYVDNPDYVLDLDLVEVESFSVYYRGFLLDD